MQAKGKTSVRLSYTDLGESAIDDKPENVVADDGTIIELREPPGDKKAYLQIKHGFTDWLAMGAAFAKHDNVFGLGEDNEYTEISLLGALPGIFSAWRLLGYSTETRQLVPAQLASLGSFVLMASGAGLGYLLCAPLTPG